MINFTKAVCLFLLLFLGGTAQAEEELVKRIVPSEKLSEFQTKALEPSFKEINLGYFYIANLWTLDARIVRWTLSSMDKAGVVNDQTYDGLAEFIEYQVGLPEESKFKIDHRYVQDALVVLSKSGNERYSTTFDLAIESRKKNRKEIKIKSKLKRHSGNPRFADVDAVVEYLVNGLAENNNDAQNEYILKSAYSSGIRSDEFWSKVNKRATAYVDRGDRSGGWWVKALGSSGNPDYRQTLLDIIARPVIAKNTENPENAIHPSIFKHASFAVARLNAYENWFRVIDEMKANKHNLSDDERHFIVMVSTPLWRVRHTGTEWMARNKYQNQVGLKIISESLRNTFVDASEVGNHDIVTAAKLLGLLGTYCDIECVSPINEIVESNVEKEIRAHALKAVNRIQKRTARVEKSHAIEKS